MSNHSERYVDEISDEIGRAFLEKRGKAAPMNRKVVKMAKEIEAGRRAYSPYSAREMVAHYRLLVQSQ